MYHCILKESCDEFREVDSDLSDNKIVERVTNEEGRTASKL